MTRGATFDLEPNSIPADAQDMSVAGQVLGHVEAGTTTEGSPVALPINLFDSEGFRWDIWRDGSISDGTSDAYDGGHDLSAFPNITTGSAEDNGREIVIGPATVSGVEVVRKIFVPQDQAYARFLEIVTNPGASTVNFTVSIDTNLGSDSSTVLVETSSGDATFTTADDWIVTDDADGTGDPTVLHVIAGPGGQRPTDVGGGNFDSVYFEYNLTLAPGETQIVMQFGAQNTNRADALAGMTGAERAQVVNFVIEPQEDHYHFQVNEGDSLVAITTTPGAGSGEPVNDLDPSIELFNENDVSVATDDNSAGDGRNARITHTVPGGSSGTYRVVVRTVTGLGGDYTLAVSGATGALPPFEVVATDPPDGGIVNVFPTTYLVDMVEAVLLPSVDAGDLLVNGSPADGVNIVDADTLAFDISSADIGEGTYTISIAGGAIAGLAGQGVLPLSATFVFDVTAPTVIASSIGEGDVVTAGPTTYQVQFNEPIATDGLGPEDVALVEDVPGRVLSGQLEQFATSATASSEYTSTEWSAAQATGAPNTFSCSDIETSWAPSTSGIAPEWLEVSFAVAVNATGLAVYETYNSGFITQIDLIEPGGTYHTIWTGTDTTGCPGEFTLTFGPTELLGRWHKDLHPAS